MGMAMAKVSKQRTAYLNNYNRQNYDRMTVALPKGMKEKLKKASGITGSSMTEILVTAFKEWCEKNGVDFSEE